MGSIAEAGNNKSTFHLNFKLCNHQLNWLTEHFWTNMQHLIWCLCTLIRWITSINKDYATLKVKEDSVVVTHILIIVSYVVERSNVNIYTRMMRISKSETKVNKAILVMIEWWKWILVIIHQSQISNKNKNNEKTHTLI